MKKMMNFTCCWWFVSSFFLSKQFCQHEVQFLGATPPTYTVLHLKLVSAAMETRWRWRVLPRWRVHHLGDQFHAINGDFTDTHCEKLENRDIKRTTTRPVFCSATVSEQPWQGKLLKIRCNKLAWTGWFSHEAQSHQGQPTARGEEANRTSSSGCKRCREQRGAARGFQMHAMHFQKRERKKVFHFVWVCFFCFFYNV